MERSLPFSSILRPVGRGEGWAYALLPSRHRSAWLLPTEPALQRAALRAFGHGRVKGFVGYTLLAAARLRGGLFRLDIAPLEARLAGMLAEPEVRLAFCIGTSGPYRKLTAQVLTRGAHVPAYAKIAADELAQASLEREYRNLQRLSTTGALQDRVPLVLGRFAWRGAHVLVVTAGAGVVGPSRLTGEHAEFLRRLHDAFVDEQPFERSAMWERLVSTVQRLRARMAGEWSARCDRALRRLGAGLGRVILPLSLAHRDFAPWNTRVGGAGLFVFDWETASDGMTPLYDAFHFEAIQAAKGNRRFYPSKMRFLDLAEAFRRTWNRHLPLLYLAYLLDMGLFYSEARLQAPDFQNQALCRWFGRQIDAYAGCPYAVA